MFQRLLVTVLISFGCTIHIVAGSLTQAAASDYMLLQQGVHKLCTATTASKGLSQEAEPEPAPARTVEQIRAAMEAIGTRAEEDYKSIVLDEFVDLFRGFISLDAKVRDLSYQGSLEQLRELEKILY
jgi:hypothetical protein